MSACANQRPNLVNAGVELNCQDNPNGLGQVDCIDPAAFALPDVFTYGDTPRNYLRGPKFSQTDVSFMKNFATGGRSRIQVRAEVFNLFNQVNWGAPGTTFGAAEFGVIASTADTHAARRSRGEVPVLGRPAYGLQATNTVG